MQLTKQQVVERINEANALARAGDYHGAESVYLEAVKRRPRDSELLRRLGVVQGNLAKFDDALGTLAKATKLDPRNAAIHLAAGWVGLQGGRAKESLEAYTRASFFGGNKIETERGIASAYERLHELDKAEEHTDNGLAHDPTSPQLLVLKARLLRRRGKTEQARLILEDADDRGLAPPDERHTILYELGVIRDKLGDHDGAFDAITRANQTQARLPRSRGYDADMPFHGIEQLRAITPEMFEAWRGSAAPDDGLNPLFLVAMPRSGTTMTERILGSHSEILGTDERAILAEVVEHMENTYAPSTPITDMLSGLSPEQIAELRSIYRRGAEPMLRDAGKHILLDKLPLQITSLPIISRLMPDARIITVLRDPRDVCLSCFFQEFAPNESMVNFQDLERTAQFYAAVMGMYLDQRERYAFERLEVRYEDTTRDPESQARRLLKFVGVVWEDQVLRFHERRDADRAVNTPSYEAVTQPVHTKAVGRWRRYEKHLAPVLPVLEPFVEAFGYEPS